MFSQKIMTVYHYISELKDFKKKEKKRKKNPQLLVCPLNLWFAFIYNFLSLLVTPTISPGFRFIMLINYLGESGFCIDINH